MLSIFTHWNHVDVGMLASRPYHLLCILHILPYIWYICVYQKLKPIPNQPRHQLMPFETTVIPNVYKRNII